MVNLALQVNCFISLQAFLPQPLSSVVGHELLSEIQVLTK